MQTLKIKVSKQKVNGGVLACRRVTVREKLLRFLLGTPIKLTVLRKAAPFSARYAYKAHSIGAGRYGQRGDHQRRRKRRWA